MLVDARRLEQGAQVSADVCIVGGGTAGLVMAICLARAGVQVVVLESGGLEPDAATRDLNRGQASGLPYHFADGCRSRYLGGSSNCWGGWCRPMQPIDLDERPWVPHSGWPLRADELAPFYEQAHKFLMLGPTQYDAEQWVANCNHPQVRRLPVQGSGLQDEISQFSPPVRTGHHYRAELQNLPGLTVYLWANLVGLASNGEHVQQAQARTLSGVAFTVQALHYVLATGAIENARLLLACAPQIPQGLGNQHDNVGRYFMDHPRVHWGRVQWAAGWARNRLYDEKYHFHNNAVQAYGTHFASQLAPTPEAQREQGLLHANVWFASIFHGEGTSAALALKRMKDRAERKEQQGYSLLGDVLAAVRQPLASSQFVLARLAQPTWLVDHVRMGAIVEPVPHPDSRVTLDPTVRDALGMPRVRVHWYLPDQVKHTFDATLNMVANHLEGSGMATVQRGPSVLQEGWPDTFSSEGTWHHMGTTRMHSDPKLGVVDKHCQVHGISNLHVAGSSVFPTAGVNFPTITLVALACRLAQRLCTRLGAQG